MLKRVNFTDLSPVSAANRVCLLASVYHVERRFNTSNCPSNKNQIKKSQREGLQELKSIVKFKHDSISIF